MTDSFEARGDFSSETSDISSDVEINLVPDFSDAPAGEASSLEAIVAKPNGFVKLGLAQELVQGQTGVPLFG